MSMGRSRGPARVAARCRWRRGRTPPSGMRYKIAERISEFVLGLS